MKKLQLLTVVALMAATSTTAIAQDQPGQRRGGGDATAMLLQGITLSADQRARVDSLGKKMMAEMQVLRADSTMEMDARRAKGREMRSKQFEAIKTVLTDDQKKVFDKNLADMQARMQQGGGQRPPQNNYGTVQ
jgi:Spy/CpxP family protein refolding chaperone